MWYWPNCKRYGLEFLEVLSSSFIEHSNGNESSIIDSGCNLEPYLNMWRCESWIYINFWLVCDLISNSRITIYLSHFVKKIKNKKNIHNYIYICIFYVVIGWSVMLIKVAEWHALRDWGIEDNGVSAMDLAKWHTLMNRRHWITFLSFEGPCDPYLSCFNASQPHLYLL